MPLNNKLKHLVFNETKHYLYKYYNRLWSKNWPESPGEIVKYIATGIRYSESDSTEGPRKLCF